MDRKIQKRKQEMQQELYERDVPTPTPLRIELPSELVRHLGEISNMRGISLDQFVITRLSAIVNSYQNQKILRLHDEMPYGQYRGILIEDMIRADPRYVNWLAAESSVFTLDEEATALLKELS